MYAERAPDGAAATTRQVGQALGRHMGVDVLTFTGSTAVGRAFLEYAAQSNLKRVWPELGGKSPNIIFADANLDKAADTAAWSIFYNQGEMCTAGSRLLVQEHLPKGIRAYPETELKVCARRISLMLETYLRTGKRRNQPVSPEEAARTIQELFGPL